MKKLIFTLAFACIASMAISSYVPPATKCEVSSDQTRNDGHCAKGDLGGDICFTEEEGPACSGTGDTVATIL